VQRAHETTTVAAEIGERAERARARPVRRWLVRIHTWTALALGLYIIVLSVSGSAVVFRRELNIWLVPRTVPSTEGVRLTGDALAEALGVAYPRDRVVELREPRQPNRPVLVTVERKGVRTDRLFDPYASRDLGESYPRILRVEEWLVDLHDNLLAGPTGRTVNGIGGAATAALIVTGVVVWWPGRRRVWRSLTPGRPSLTRQFARRLHNTLGVWCFGLLFIWCLTAVYFAFPDPVEHTIDYFDADLTDTERPGEAVLLELIRLHFGRFGGLGVRFTYVVLGLVPAVLLVTGFVLWWSRVVRRRPAAEP
jgi:uncharacterized iron-regulated membrane protein